MSFKNAIGSIKDTFNNLATDGVLEAALGLFMVGATALLIVGISNDTPPEHSPQGQAQLKQDAAKMFRDNGFEVVGTVGSDNWGDGSLVIRETLHRVPDNGRTYIGTVRGDDGKPARIIELKGLD